MSHDVDRPPLHALAGVRYDGLSDLRIITTADLDAVGVTLDRDLSWVPGETISVSRLNAGVVDRLAADPDFTLIPRDDDEGDGDA